MRGFPLSKMGSEELRLKIQLVSGSGPLQRSVWSGLKGEWKVFFLDLRETISGGFPCRELILLDSEKPWIGGPRLAQGMEDFAFARVATTPARCESPALALNSPIIPNHPSTSSLSPVLTQSSALRVLLACCT